MATTAKNNLVRAFGAVKKLSYPVDAAGTYKFNAGDMVYYDTSAKFLKALASGAQAAFVGVAEDSSEMNVYGTASRQPQATVIVGQIHQFAATVGDAVAHGAAVYCGADAQTVTTTDPGSGQIVGYIQLRPGAAAATAVAGDMVDVLVIPNYPTTGLA